MALGAVLLIGTLLPLLPPLLLPPLEAATMKPSAAPYSSTSSASTTCNRTCGNVSVPFPFGVGDGCYSTEYGNFSIRCDETFNPPKPFMGDFEILDISITDGQLRARGLIAYDCYNLSGPEEHQSFGLNLTNRAQLTFSHTRNKFVVLGCDTSYTGGCISYCESLDSLQGMEGSCSGVGCCATAIPRGLRSFFSSISSYYKHSNCLEFNPCSYAFLTDEKEYSFKVSDLKYYNRSYKPPVVLDWSIGSQTCDERLKSKPEFACRGINSECINSSNGKGYNCRCKPGYEGNPYLPGGEPDGCRDVDECRLNSTICPSNGRCTNMEGSYSCTCPPGTSAENPKEGPCETISHDGGQDIALRLKIGLGVGVGLLLLMAVSSSLCWGSQRSKLVEQTRKIKELKQKIFEQNGGLFLQELISSQQGNTFNIFTEEELARATNNFDDTLIIGRGGHGIVYKGILKECDKEVAIKKSNMVEERQSKEFAREIGILSQINHVNVVKLLGCCLEVEIPMLVYEYVQCGTLYDFIHHQKHNGRPISLGLRLRIATEAAEALAYLHSYASRPILHGDVKTSNILLDEQYRAKVADFGASTLAPVDEVQLATVVQGTCGYLDPEYMQTYQLTVKSDVYSFGVVLAELLTGKKPLQLRGPEDERGLAVSFVSSLRENKLMQILDAQVVKEGEPELLWEIAELTSRCLSMRGDDRPAMKEVVTALHVSTRSHPWIPYAPEEAESLLDAGEPSSTYERSDINATTGYLSMGNHGMLEIEAGR